MEPETLVALIDIFKLVGLKPFSVTKSDMNKALNFEDTLLKHTKSIIKGKSVKIGTNVKVSDAEKLIEAIATSDITNIAQDLVKDTGASPDVMVVLADVISYLQTIIPEVDGKSELTRFIWKCRMIDNPFFILQLVSEFKLTPLDVTSLKEAYPETYKIIVQAFINTLVEEVKDVKELRRPLKMMIAMLLESPILDDKTVKAYTISENYKPTELNVVEG